MERTVQNSSGKTFFKGRYLNEDDMLYCQWIGFVNEIEPSKKACMAVVDLIETYHADALMNDNREQSGPWPKLDEWLGTVWIPAMAQKGLKYFAHIHSESAFTQISANNVLKQSISGIEFAHFKTEEAAMMWLKERQKARLKG
jgi:hypothetical protein